MVYTPNGDGDMMVAKWLSLENLIHNKHSGRGNSLRSAHMEGLLDETKRRSGLRDVNDIHVPENTIQN